MYKNILVPVAPDHEHDPSLAIKLAKTLLSDGGKVTLLSVVEAIPAYVEIQLPKGQMAKNIELIKEKLSADAKGDDDIMLISVEN